MKNINKTNLQKEIISNKAWSAYNKSYFGKIKPLQELWRSFEKERIMLPKKINIADWGGADGKVGEFFKQKLIKNHEVNLYIVDILKKVLDKNKNKETIKINQDIRQFIQKEKFDLIIMRSVLHYFNKRDKKIILKNIYNSLKTNSYFLVQMFIQNLEDLELFYKLNKFVGRNLQLSNKKELNLLFKEAGFSQVKNLGNLKTWDLSSKVFQKRYNLTNKQLEKIREIIQKTPLTKRKGFTLTTKGFTIPIPYIAFLLKK